MTPPRPPEIVKRIATLRRLASEISKGYQWGHALAYSRSGNGQRAGSPEAINPRKGRDPEDPTGNVATDRQLELQRRRLEDAAKAVEFAEAALFKARAAIKYNLRDPDPEPERGGPRIISKATLKEARDAQRRRRARGEILGES
jgi:hypothetical protein